MTQRKPRNIGASVLGRLKHLSDQSREDYNFLLQRYVAERFLYRLGESQHREKFVLKGAMLLALWGGGTYRPTRDLDFTAYGNSWKEHLRGSLQEICSIPAEDGVVFVKEELKLESIRDQAAYNSFRARLKAKLGSALISLQIDIGFGNAIQPSPIDSEYSTLLGHSPPQIRVYPREAFVAEKLHAMVVLGARNSRYKDFYDLYTLTKHFAFHGKPLIEAVRATFQLRGTPFSQQQPVALTPQFYADADRAQEWRSYIERNKLKGAPSDFGIVGERLATFLREVWRVIANEIPFTAMWPKGGPWHGRPYAAYKDSAIEWLGKLPAHWEVNRLKDVANVQLSNVDKKSVEGQVDVQLCNYVDVYYKERIHANFDFMAATATRAQIRRFALSSGDVLITKDSESWTDIAVPALVTQDLPRVLCGYHLAHIRPFKRCDGAFLSYGFAARGPRDQFYVAANGITRFGLSGDAIRSGLFPLPPLSEQRAIARFLDRETAKIDALVAKKERLIELLQEKRAALVAWAVTKGLDPDVPMKDSPVEWVGEIPAHWSHKRLKAIARIRYGLGQPPREFSGGLPLIRATNVVRGHITKKGMAYVDSADLPKNRDAYLAAKEIIVVRSGAYAADSAIISRGYGGAVAGYDMVVTVHGAAPEFVAFSFLSPYVRDAQWIVLSIRSAQPHLNSEELGSAVIFLPPLAEQQAIVEFLEQETAKIRALITKVREAIDRYKELRTALISAAVTGKIDVREDVA